MDDNVDILYPLVGRFDARRSPGAHDLGEEAEAGISALTKAEVFATSVLLDVGHHVIRLSAGGIKNLDRVILRDNVEAVCVRQPVKPMRCVECSFWRILHLVHTGTSSKETATRPCGNCARNRDLNRPTLLGQAVKLYERGQQISAHRDTEGAVTPASLGHSLKAPDATWSKTASKSISSSVSLLRIGGAGAPWLVSSSFGFGWAGADCLVPFILGYDDSRSIREVGEAQSNT